MFRLLEVMEEWIRAVRGLKDESEDPYLTERLTHKIYHLLRNKKLKDKAKFRERTGLEFESFIDALYVDFPEALVKEVISDDDFWLITLAVTHVA